jgi:hypothetical protein
VTKATTATATMIDTIKDLDTSIVIILVVVAVTVLSINGKFNNEASMFFGTLIGYLVGSKKSAGLR